MIDIKELSIGNYFRVAHEGLCIKKGTIIKVNGIDAENKLMKKGLVGAISCHPLDEDQLDGGIWLAYLEPIEITPEILEKNGWEVNVNNINPKKWIAVLVENTAIIHGDETFIIITTDGGEIRFPFRYVHQLQNILTLCGINKEIEL